MISIAKHFTLYHEYRKLITDLEYKKNMNSYHVEWFPTNKVLYEITKEQIRNYHVENFATDFINVLKIYVSDNVKTDRIEYNNENGCRDTDPTIRFDPVYWDPNCYIFLKDKRIQFNVVSDLHTTISFKNSYGQLYEIYFKIDKNMTLEKHILLCIDAVERKINEVEVNDDTISKTKKKYPLIVT